MKCPSCGAASEGGRFCANCGAALGTPKCPDCGHQPPAGARFCNQCGNPMGGSPTRAGSSGNQVAWWMAGALLLGLILVIAYPAYGPGRAAAPPPVAAGPVAGPAGVDLSSMTPREAADRLFNRVMTAVAADDSTEVVSFLPMAIRALELAAPLDTDGKFHLVLLRLTGQFNAEALEGAEEILSEQPNHLLGLAMAGTHRSHSGTAPMLERITGAGWMHMRPRRARISSSTGTTVRCFRKCGSRPRRWAGTTERYERSGSVADGAIPRFPHGRLRPARLPHRRAPTR